MAPHLFPALVTLSSVCLFLAWTSQVRGTTITHMHTTTQGSDTTSSPMCELCCYCEQAGHVLNFFHNFQSPSAKTPAAWVTLSEVIVQHPCRFRLRVLRSTTKKIYKTKAITFEVGKPNFYKFEIGKNGASFTDPNGVTQNLILATHTSLQFDVGSHKVTIWKDPDGYEIYGDETCNYDLKYNQKIKLVGFWPGLAHPNYAGECAQCLDP